MTLFTPRPRAARRRVPSLVDVVLDPAQKAAVERPAGRALLVLGEAGVGKTTVALHRLAHLWRSAPPGSPLRAAVVVPTDGLVRLLQPALRKLGVDLEVLTYDRWASTQARRVFRRLPRESDLTPPSVMAIKRHPALRPVLDELAARPPGRIDDDVDAPVRRSAAHVTRGDLQHLFGDRVLLERVARAAGLTSRSVIDTLDRTRIQFSPTAEQEWAHVTDRERLLAVDHRGLDEGTATGNAATMDVEDYAVLFELERLRSIRAGHPAVLKPTYDLLMLDEAQELAPLELALLGRSMKPGSTLVVAGDAHQQTDETATFLGWDAAMRELGCPDHETVELAIGYRCAPDVVALAHGILDPARAGGAGAGTGAATPLHAFADEAALGAWLAPGLRELQRRDPRASIAVVCRHPRTARRLTTMLQAAEIPARVVFDGRFLVRGPVQVSIVEEVKGLEFDFVVVPDAGAREYPDDAAARRALYVAVTRARHEVALACVGQGTRVVPVGR